MADGETIGERIRADHRRVMEGIAELERRVAGRRDDTRRPVLGPMRLDLLAHMTAEEEFVYTLLETEMRSWIENARREHQEIREHLAALAADGMPAPAWEQRLHELRLVLERHIAEEERAVIPQVGMKYDLVRLRELGDEFARRETEARKAHGARWPRAAAPSCLPCRARREPLVVRDTEAGRNRYVRGPVLCPAAPRPPFTVPGRCIMRAGDDLTVQGEHHTSVAAAEGDRALPPYLLSRSRAAPRRSPAPPGRL